MTISMTKVKNALKKQPEHITYAKLSNIRINGDLRGCSGFLINHHTGDIIYINTEPSLLSGKLLYRSAVSTNDYTGGRNHFCDENDFLTEVISTLISDEALV